MSAAWAWLVLAVLVAVFVAAFDVWAHLTGHALMTTQMRWWIADRVIGPFIIGGWVGAFVAVMWHFLVRGR